MDKFADWNFALVPNCVCKGDRFYCRCLKTQYRIRANRIDSHRNDREHIKYLHTLLQVVETAVCAPRGHLPLFHVVPKLCSLTGICSHDILPRRVLHMIQVAEHVPQPIEKQEAQANNHIRVWLGGCNQG